jgi:fimbrial chaperone protein
MRIVRPSFALAGAALALMLPSLAGASAFSVNPISLQLGTGVTNSVVTVGNTGSDTIRFQVKGYAWAESPQGDLQLTPSPDLVAFPTLFSLDGGKSRKLRLGSTVAPGATEKAYRAIVEELPPLGTIVAPPGKADSIIIRTRIGIPVFIRPANVVVKADISSPVIKQSTLAFDVNNTGTVHFIATKARLHGMSVSGATVFAHEFSGWYVLAGGKRSFSVPIPADVCAKIQTISIELAGDPVTMTKKFDHLSPDCGR